MLRGKKVKHKQMIRCVEILFTLALAAYAIKS